MNADLGSDSDSDDGDFDPKKEKREGAQPLYEIVLY